ncbi:MAG: anaerobic ribonucleoside-triphosphate reductase activating protein [Firmicutes bacterium]|nr:anaerobic ribonucleoside-triphosphate reductase activating protein [Bacillota bacterium]
MYYGNIKNNDIADGTGVRVSLFVSGCRNACEGCFQPETWSFTYGKPFTKAVLERVMTLLSPPYIEGLTILGGEPFEPENQATVLKIVKSVRQKYKNKKNIWIYTGYTFDKDLREKGKRYTENTEEILINTDVLVDGRFILEKKDISLAFRGSSNQRIIDVKKSLLSEKVVEVQL